MLPRPVRPSPPGIVAALGARGAPPDAADREDDSDWTCMASESHHGDSASSGEEDRAGGGQGEVDGAEGGQGQNVAVARGPRQLRGMPWGPFSIAKVKSTHPQTGVKRHISWGATCGQHCNAGNLAVCKKQLVGTDDLTKRMICHWLLLGHRCCGPTARSDHLDKPVRDLPVPSWDELVAQRIEMYGE